MAAVNYHGNIFISHNHVKPTNPTHYNLVVSFLMQMLPTRLEGNDLVAKTVYRGQSSLTSICNQPDYYLRTLLLVEYE